MAKILAFDLTRHAPTPPTPTARACPAEAWLTQRKPGQSRRVATAQINIVARLLGYGEGEADSWRAVPWGSLRRGDVLRVRSELAGQVASDVYTPKSAGNILAALRSVLKESWRAGYMTAEEYAAAVDVKPIEGNRLRRPRRVLTEAEFVACLAVCEADYSARGVRDAALFALAAATGLRASEYAALQVDDYDRRARLLQVRSIKTGDSRVVPLAPEVCAYLDAWLTMRGPGPGVLFTRLERNGRVGVIQAIRADGISGIMERRGEEAGLAHFASHATRRGFVTLAVNKTGNLGLVSKLVGHANPATTARAYYQPEQDEMRAAVETIGLPKRSTP